MKRQQRLIRSPQTGERGRRSQTLKDGKADNSAFSELEEPEQPKARRTTAPMRPWASSCDKRRKTRFTTCYLRSEIHARPSRDGRGKIAADQVNIYLRTKTGRWYVRSGPLLTSPSGGKHQLGFKVKLFSSFDRRPAVARGSIIVDRTTRTYCSTRRGACSATSTASDSRASISRRAAPFDCDFRPILKTFIAFAVDLVQEQD